MRFKVGELNVHDLFLQTAEVMNGTLELIGKA